MSLRDIGLLFSFRNPEYNRLPWDEFYRNELGLTVYAEELGFDTVWLTEHHFIDDGYSPSLFVIGGAIAAQTKKIRIGTYIVLMPLHDAVFVAEDATAIDIISGGRFDLGLGLGYRPGEFTGLGISMKERGARLSEAAPLIRELLAGGEVNHEGKFYTAKNVKLTPTPVQDPMPIWLAARADAALDRAAKGGFHLAGIGAPEHQLGYIEALKRHGRNPKDFNIAQLVVGFCGPDTQSAWDRCSDGLNHMLKNYMQWGIESGDITGEDAWNVDNLVPSPDQFRQNRQADFFGQPAHIGTPDEVYESLVKYIQSSPEEAPITHLVVMMDLPGVKPEHARESMKLFAEEVAPRLRKL